MTGRFKYSRLNETFSALLQDGMKIFMMLQWGKVHGKKNNQNESDGAGFVPNQVSSLCFLPLQKASLISVLVPRRGREATMITRSNLAEQLREHQIRSKHDWASVSFSSTSSNIATSRNQLGVEVAVFVIWVLVILAFLVFSAVSLYFRHIQLAFILVCLTVLLHLCMKITKQIRLSRKKKRRMFLPLSM